MAITIQQLQLLLMGGFEMTYTNLAKEQTGKSGLPLVHQRCCGSNENIYIEKEHGTGWMFYILRVNGIAYCSSKNIAPMPHSFSDPIQTDVLINKKALITVKNPDYEHITIVPGLTLEYLVYDGDSPNIIAKMTRVYKKLFESSDKYEIYADDEIYADGKFPFPILSISNNGAIEPELLEWLPENDVCVSIYADKSFMYDSRFLVEERYVVSIAKQHLQWLPHVFHAYLLGLRA